MVTVLLPSYRREHDQFFEAAIQSILNQTLTSLELIIIDDASTEHRDKYIERIMEVDGRVSCLRHRKNIGLPAVSEFEGFLRARGQYLAFGFDDFVFENNALLELVTAAADAPNSVVHGFVQWFDLAGGEHFYGKDPSPQEKLKFHNFLGNGSFLVPRSILENVGLYDPHIAASRLCDWDLWRRIGRKYPIIHLPVLIGREYGTTRADSIGHTYPLFEEAMQEYFSIDRDVALRPDNYAAFNVWQLPKQSSALLTTHVLNLRSFFKSSRSWASDLEIGEDASSVTAPTTATIAVYGSLNLMTSLIFDGVPNCSKYNLLYIPPERDDIYLSCCLTRCSALIVASHPLSARCEYIRRICSLLKIPIYYLPEHTVELAPSKTEEAVAQYMAGETAILVRDLDGILCSSDAVVRTVRKHWPRCNVHQVGIILDSDKRSKLNLLKTEDHSDLCVALIGGDSPNRIHKLIAAVERIAQRRPVRLLTSPGIDCRNLSVPVTIIDESHSSQDSLTHWKQHKPDIVIGLPDQEGLGLGANLAMLLVACYLGSVPILPDQDVFQGLGGRQGVLRADGSTESYENAILLAADPRTREGLLQSLNEYCETRFNPECTHHALSELVKRCPPLDAANVLSRLRALVIETFDTVHSAEARAAAVEKDLLVRIEHMNRLLAAQELELRSRSYQLALKIRRCAYQIRAILKGLRLD
jgi:glycosyltransferase involved in cell wall biosynthesis